MAQKTVLGKGLASLLPPLNPPPTSFPPAPPSSASTASFSTSSTSPSTPSVMQSVGQETQAPARDRHMGISMIAIEEIQANHLQPRHDFDPQALEELSQSIKVSGIIQPLVVRKTPKDGFELIAGERRLRAAKLAGLKQVPIVIRRSTDRESLEIALIENIQRENLNCIDEARAYFQLIQDFSLTQEEIAERVGKDRATVANYLRLLRLPEAIILDLKKQALTFGHGKALLGLEDAELRMRVRSQILEKGLNVRETEALVDSIKNPNKNKGITSSSGVSSPLVQRLNNLSQELARQWSAKVEVKGTEQRGKIVIHYSSRQELDRILDGMQNEKT